MNYDGDVMRVMMMMMMIVIVMVIDQPLNQRNRR